MLYRKLGASGLKVSAISLGSWRTFGVSVDADATRACMQAAYDAGVNFFDGAEAYGGGAAEKAMGAVFKVAGWPRDTLIISSKVIRVGKLPTQGGLSRKHLVEACDAALDRMGLDYLDLFFCHRPDPDTPLEEIVHTMNELIGRGKIFYWGTSEFSASDLQALYAIADRDRLVGPTMEQTNHSMLHRQRVEGELKPLYARHGLGTTIYSPLAVGLLTGKYNDGVPAGSAYDKAADWMKRQLTPETIAKVRQLAALAAERGMSTAQLALAWCLKNPNVSTAIIGATRPEQVIENTAAADHVESLTPEVMARIEQILNPPAAAEA
jgi:voltage-dependent potassium channel beta subunit